jgi:hypothetical protein
MLTLLASLCPGIYSWFQAPCYFQVPLPTLNPTYFSLLRYIQWVPGFMLFPSVPSHTLPYLLLSAQVYTVGTRLHTISKCPFPHLSVLASLCPGIYSGYQASYYFQVSLPTLSRTCFSLPRYIQWVPSSILFPSVPSHT